MAEQECVGFIDMDCFYVAVERTLNGSLDGVPCAVCQYESQQKTTKTVDQSEPRIVAVGGASLIAVSYEARARGVTRMMNTGAAWKQCPELVTVMVPTANGKANMALYKDAGQAVCEILAEFAESTEKRSVDEVALDVTRAARDLLGTMPFPDILREALAPGSHLADSKETLEMTHESHAANRKGSNKQKERLVRTSVGGEYDEAERMMMAAAVIVSRARKAVNDRLGFSCSGGVAPTKQLAKLGCGLHKPNQQTIVLPRHIEGLLADLPLDRLQGLGGKEGKAIIERLGIKTAGDLAALTPGDLLRTGACSDEGSARLYIAMARGTYRDPVVHRMTYKSFAASKTFFRTPLDTNEAAEAWLKKFSEEIWERVTKDREKHGRAPTNVTISVNTGGNGVSRTEKLSIGWVGSAAVVHDGAVRLFRRFVHDLRPPLGIQTLGVGVGNFEDLPKEGKGGGIMNLFKSTKPSGSVQGWPPPPPPPKRSSSSVQGGMGKFLGKARAPPPARRKPAAKGMEAFLDRPSKKARGAPAEVIDVDARLHRPANDVVLDVDAEPWTCSTCTYQHPESEAGFLACAMCGTPKA